jgi:hypothetical protein
MDEQGSLAVCSAAVARRTRRPVSIIRVDVPAREAFARPFMSPREYRVGDIESWYGGERVVVVDVVHAGEADGIELVFVKGLPMKAAPLARSGTLNVGRDEPRAVQ